MAMAPVPRRAEVDEAWRMNVPRAEASANLVAARVAKSAQHRQPDLPST
jgi:hypothetical protein